MNRRMWLVVAAVLVASALVGALVGTALAGGPWGVLWKAECPAFGQVVVEEAWNGGSVAFCQVWDRAASLSLGEGF